MVTNPEYVIDEKSYQEDRGELETGYSDVLEHEHWDSNTNNWRARVDDDEERECVCAHSLTISSAQTTPRAVQALENSHL